MLRAIAVCLLVLFVACSDRSGGDAPPPSHGTDASTGASDAGEAGTDGSAPPPDVSQCDDQGAC